MNAPSTSYSLLPNTIDAVTILTNGEETNSDPDRYSICIDPTEEEHRPLRGASDSRLYIGESIEQQGTRSWHLQAYGNQTPTNSSLTVPLPTTRLNRALSSPKHPSGRPPLENQAAICQNNYFPFDGYSSSEFETDKNDDAKSEILPASASSPSGFQLANGRQYNSIINARSELAASSGASASSDFAAIKLHFDEEEAFRNVDDEVDEAEEVVELEPYGLDETCESWRLVDEDDQDDRRPATTTANWLSCVKNFATRPSSTASSNCDHRRHHHRGSFDCFPHQEAVKALGHQPLSVKRRRTGSAVVLDGVMVGNNNLQPNSYGQPKPPPPSLQRHRKTSLFHYGARSPQQAFPMQTRRQSAAAFPNRLPPVPLQHGFFPQDLLTDQRKTSTASLAAMTFSNVAQQRSRSPSQQWLTSNHSGNCLTTMPLVSVSDGGPGCVGTSGHPSTLDALGNHHPNYNPLYDVSNEFMRVTGYTQQFKRLLSKRKTQPKRQSSAPSAPNAGGVGVGSFDHGVRFDKDGRTIAGLGSSHELHERTTITAAAVALGGRRPPSPPNGADGNGTAVGSADDRRPTAKLGKQRSAYGRLWKEHPNFKHRLRKRKHLFYQRIKVSDFSLLFALAGIVLTVMEAELSSANYIKKTEYVSLLLRSLVVATTVVLLSLIVCYHAIETKIAVIDSGAEDWRVAITQDRLWQCAIEVLVCSVCPFPGGSLNVNWDRIDANDHRTTKPISVPLDAILSVPMFLRSYLACRFMALHSRQFQDAATRSIAALNHIAVNFTFVLKTLMHEHPLRVLVLFTVTFWVAMSWILTQCERYKSVDEGREDNHYLNSVWFVIITFMSIGYGDIVPNTYCGRALAITTGIVGAGVSSALIAVISRKLELSRAEKHVNQFMTDSKLTRQRKEAAASVLQHTWFIHKYKNIPKEKDDTKLRVHQRKFLAAINEFRKVKWDQRKLAEQGNALVDVAKLQNDMHETLWDMQQNQDLLVAQLGILMQKVQELQDVIVGQISQSGHAGQPSGTFRKVGATIPTNKLLQQPIAPPLTSIVYPVQSPIEDTGNQSS